MKGIGRIGFLFISDHRRDVGYWHFAAFQTQARNGRSWVHSGQTGLSTSAKYAVNDPKETCAQSLTFVLLLTVK
jgi:biotin-(acetyl-CoA carboxylase) ligase